MAHGRYFGWTCPKCGAADNEAQLVVTSLGFSGSTTGPFEGSFPGEGAEWYADAGLDCYNCSFEWTDEEFQQKFEDKIQQMLSEPYDPD
jgi:hypothetical protein